MPCMYALFACLICMPYMYTYCMSPRGLSAAEGEDDTRMEDVLSLRGIQLGRRTRHTYKAYI